MCNCDVNNEWFGVNSKRWEDVLPERMEFDSAGNVKTQIVRSPFVQVLVIERDFHIFYYIHLCNSLHSCR